MERSIDFIRKELTNWPDVEYEVKSGGKHPKLVLKYGEQSRFVSFSTTAVDRRGVLNKLREIRLQLTALGASRN